MKRSLLLFFTILISISARAIKVEWGTVVKEYSSQRGDQQYSAKQALEKPNVLPQGGDTPCAWSPAKPNNSKKEEYIKVRVNHPVFARQVIVCESLNPGAISEVYVYSSAGEEHKIFENEDPAHAGSATRVWSHVFDAPTKYKIRDIKVVLRTDKVDGFNAIDAIGVSESEKPFTPSVNEVKADFGSRENVGEQINSAYAEYLPQISPDGKTLYFARRQHPQNTGSKGADDIWVSQRIGSNSWEEAVKLPAPLNDEYDNYVYNITPDGSSLLLGNEYKKGEQPLPGVSKSYRTVDGWSYPVAQEIEGFFNAGAYNEFFLGANKKILMMTTDIGTSEGYGDNDLYVSFLKKDKKWSKPKNLGPVLNTAGAEAAPFLAADNKTLFFASEGFSGYGKNDIYITKRLDDTWENWSEPINMGEAINSDENELYFSMPASGNYAYFVSSKQTLGMSDIFRVKLPAEIKPQPVTLVSGKVINVKTKQELQANIAYEILPEGIEVGVAQTNAATGQYKIVLPQDNEYAFHAVLKNFIPVSERIDLKRDEGEGGYEEIEKTLFVVPVVMGQRMLLQNVGFVRSKSELLEHSFPELNRLAQIMKDYPTMEIKLQGHTDNTGTAPEENLRLSKDRAGAIKNYLVDKGVQEKRMTFEGFGGKKPIASNKSEATRKLNRRVEYIITKI